MKITKFVHSCLLVETPGRVALFDPGVMSTPHIDLATITKLDDLFITHEHADHKDTNFIKQLVAKFPEVRITTTNEVVQQLAAERITASNQAPDGVVFFSSVHEPVEPVFSQPQNIGIHYLDILTNPGDSHSFHETKAVLALPITAPWGAFIKAITVAIELKPQHVLPIHDWHWSDDARAGSYDIAEQKLGEQGITFHKPQTGQPIDIQV